jgi:large subunit ribosomal protein L21
VHAVVESGGKQYRVAVGEALNVERLDGAPGQELVLDRVLLVSDGEGKVHVGSPLCPGVAVRAEVVAQGRGEKILVFKYKPKVNYRRRKGHRQAYTRIRVTAIDGVPDAAGASPDTAGGQDA